MCNVIRDIVTNSCIIIIIIMIIHCNLQELFDTVSARDVLGFIGDVGLYHLI